MFACGGWQHLARPARPSASSPAASLFANPAFVLHSSLRFLPNPIPTSRQLEPRSLSLARPSRGAAIEISPARSLPAAGGRAVPEKPTKIAPSPGGTIEPGSASGQIKWDTVPSNFARISLKTKDPCTKEVGHFCSPRRTRRQPKPTRPKRFATSTSKTRPAVARVLCSSPSGRTTSTRRRPASALRTRSA